MGDSLNQYLAEHFQITLTASQQEAVSALVGPVCVISCPGSGKTTVTVIRLANLLVTGGVKGQNVLALTFSKAAAADMNRRFHHLFPSWSQAVKFSTIHSFAFQVIRHYQQSQGVQFTLINANKKQILSAIYLDATQRYMSDDEFETMSAQIGLLKNLMIEPHEKQAIKKHVEDDLDQFIQIYKAYEAYKEQNYCLDYDDLLTKAHSILSTHEPLRRAYQEQYTHIQVDEAQDISKVQFELIKLVATPHNHLFVVGDDDQSIYSFRGAYPQQLLGFKDTYNEAKIIYMSENFRSSKTLVQAAGSFIKMNKHRYKKEITTPNPKGEIPLFHHFNSDIEQLEYLVEHLKSTPAGESVAVLYRQNISAVLLMELLVQNDISFSMQEGGLTFFNHPIVRDVLAFFQLAQNPRDRQAFERVGRVLYLPATIIQQTLNQPGSNYLDYLSRSVHFKSAFQKTKVQKFKENLPQLLTFGPNRAIHYLLNTLDYESYLIKRGFLKEEKEERVYTQGLAVLETLKRIAITSGEVDRFLNRMAQLSQISRPHVGSGVALLTFHASKGLEFDRVFMIDCMNDITPAATALSSQRDRDDTEYEEERRLFYVAMTRAKSQLEVLSSASKHGLLFNRSNFFKEAFQIVHPNLTETKEETPLKKETTSLRRSLKELTQIHPIALQEFPVETRVVHQKFGEGVITEREGEIAAIQFSDELRRISLRITLENGNLQKKE